MLKLTPLISFFFLVLFAIDLSGGAAKEPVSEPPAGDENVYTFGADFTRPGLRTVVFPDGESIGRLVLIEDLGPLVRKKVVSLLAARGAQKIDVPRGYSLAFEPNRRLFEDPDSLNKIGPDSVDCLKLSFTSLDDREDAMVRRVLANVPHLTGLKWLNLTRADVSDADLLHLKNLPNLEWIECPEAPVTGSCFRTFSALPKLRGLTLAGCSLESKYLTDLSQLKSLERLNLNRTRLTPAGLAAISRCRRLSELFIGFNRLDDSCLKSLLPLKELRLLDIRSTQITPAGLAQLSGLRLKDIMISDTGNTQKDLPQLKKLFPGLHVTVSKSGPLSADMKDLLRPISK